MSLICILAEFLGWLKSEIDPITKDQMANLGCPLVCTFGDYLAPILVTVHTVKNLDHGNELENEGYESD